MKIILTLLLALTIFQSQAQITLNGVTLPAELNYNSTNLSLNGGGIRTKLIFKLYSAGLYLETEKNDPNEILEADLPMAIRLVITSNKINSNNMSEAIEEGFTKSTEGKNEPIQTRIDGLVGTFAKDAIVPGDIFDMVYVPGLGVQSYKNGTLRSTYPGLDFKAALFGIWLSDNAVGGSLKKGMLGG